LVELYHRTNQTVLDGDNHRRILQGCGCKEPQTRGCKELLTKILLFFGVSVQGIPSNRNYKKNLAKKCL